MKLLSVLLIAGLAAGLYLEWLVYPIHPPALLTPLQIAAQANKTPLAPTTVPFVFSLRPREAYRLIARRNLFSASRRPEDPEPPPAPPPVEVKPVVVEEQKPDGLVLKAIFIIGNKRIAVIRDSQINKTLHLAVGDKIRDWSLSNITQETIEIISPQGTKSNLDLRIFRSPKPKAETVADNANVNPGADTTLDINAQPQSSPVGVNIPPPLRRPPRIPHPILRRPPRP